MVITKKNDYYSISNYYYILSNFILYFYFLFNCTVISIYEQLKLIQVFYDCFKYRFSFFYNKINYFL